MVLSPISRFTLALAAAAAMVSTATIAIGVSPAQLTPQPTTPVPVETLRRQSWLQDRGNSDKSGFTRWALAGAPGNQVLWRVDLGRMTAASPVVDTRGTIFVAGVKNAEGAEQLVSVTRDGHVNWSFVIDPNVRSLSTPAIKRNGQILLTAIGGPSLYLYRVSGPQLVDKALVSDGALVSSPTLDGEDNAYVWHNFKRDGVDYGYQLTRFDSGFDVATRTWKPIGAIAQGLVGVGPSCYPPLHWGCYSPEFAAIDPNPSLPAPAFGTCFDLVATSYQTLRVRRSGSRVWHNAVAGVRTPAMGVAGMLYIVTTNDTFTEFALEAGQQGRGVVGIRPRVPPPRPNWHHSFGGGLPVAPPAIGIGAREAGDDSRRRCNADARDHRTFAEVDDVYIPVSDGFLYAFDYKGRVRWKQQNPERQFLSAPVVIALADGEQIIVVVDSAGDLRAFNRAGTALWQVRLDSPARGSPAVGHGRIYVATERSLYAIGSPVAQPPSAPLVPGTR